MVNNFTCLIIKIKKDFLKKIILDQLARQINHPRTYNKAVAIEKERMLAGLKIHYLLYQKSALSTFFVVIKKETRKASFMKYVGGKEGKKGNQV